MEPVRSDAARQPVTLPLAPDDPLWVHAMRVFKDPELAATWFRTQHLELAMTPLEASAKPDGRQKVESILTKIGHGFRA